MISLNLRFIRGFLLIALYPAIGYALTAVPTLQGHLTDLTKTLTVEQTQEIEQSLTTFENRKGTQVAILILPSTGTEPIEPFAMRVAEKWKIGRKRQDDGVILVIAKADRTVRIEVGYGLEGVLTDLQSQRIIEDIILPHFKRDDLYGGITSGIADIMQKIDREPIGGAANVAEPPTKATASEARKGIPTWSPNGITDLSVVLIGALFIGSVLRLLFGRIPGALLTGVLVTAIAWFVIGALFFALVAGTAALGLTLWGSGLLGIAARLLAGGRGGGRGGGGGLGGGGFRGGGGGFGGGGGSGRW